MKRRNLLHWLVGGSMGASMVSIFYPVLRFILPPRVQDSGMQRAVVDKPELPPNSGEIVQLGNQPALLIRTSDGDYRAFNAVCPHLGCTVHYEPEARAIVCPCHVAVFDLFGRNISGPPPRPLTPYQVNLQDGKIVITRDA